MRFGDFDPYDFTEARFPFINQHAAIDIRRLIACTALQQQVCFLAYPFDKNRFNPAYEALQPSPGYF